MQEMIKRAKELLADGTVVRVLGWKRCDLPYNPEPAFFGTEKELDALVYDGFCGANLSKYMIEAGKKEGRTLVFLKPCDTYSFNQLVKEHRVDRRRLISSAWAAGESWISRPLRDLGSRELRPWKRTAIP
jgi:formate dehydrogenase subunit beta